MAFPNGSIQQGKLVLGNPPSEVDFRAGFRPQLDDVMVRQLERLLHQYRGVDYQAQRAVTGWRALDGL